MDTKWKDLVLKSGLPLEYEVKAYLDDKGLVPSHEFAYLRTDPTASAASPSTTSESWCSSTALLTRGLAKNMTPAA